VSLCVCCLFPVCHDHDVCSAPDRIVLPEDQARGKQQQQEESNNITVEIKYGKRITLFPSPASQVKERSLLGENIRFYKLSDKKHGKEVRVSEEGNFRTTRNKVLSEHKISHKEGMGMGITRQ
jgi:hypothetical protein